MRTVNEKLISAIESAIKQGLSKFEAQNEDNSLSDLYLYFDEENASLVIYDDIENRLVNVDLDNITGSSGQSHEKDIFEAAKIASEKLDKAGIFNKEYIFKPFSISIVDSDFIVSEELIFIDNETLKLDDSLFGDLDKELNDFFRDLMK